MRHVVNGAPMVSKNNITCFHDLYLYNLPYALVREEVSLVETGCHQASGVIMIIFSLYFAIMLVLCCFPVTNWSPSWQSVAMLARQGHHSILTRHWDTAVTRDTGAGKALGSILGIPVGIPE